MTFELEFDVSQLGDVFILSPDETQQVQGAMGERLFEIVRLNLGETGIDRPIEWLPLSESYAKRVKRDYATLELTGALAAAIVFDNSNPEYASVSISDSEIPYATEHQWGGKFLPARPYFPMSQSGEFTTFSTEQVLEAGQQALNSLSS